MAANFFFRRSTRAARIFFRGALITLIWLGGLSAEAARAQNGRQDPPDEVVRVTSSLVQLNVGVVNSQGRPITNLTRGDFVVYENDVRQDIQSFEPTTAPFSVVLLLDTSGSTINFRNQMKLAATRFVDALDAGDRIAVVQFDAKPKTLVGFTGDRNKAGYAVSIANGKGETRFYQALQHSLNMLAKESNRRKAIVVLTDGVDTGAYRQDGARVSGSGATTPEAALELVRADNNAELADVLRMADKQGVSVYPLALPSGDPQRIHDPTPRQTAIYVTARARLQSLADRTGGRLNEVYRIEQMAQLYAEVAAELRTLYTLAYQPKTGSATTANNATNNNPNWRAIRIEVATVPDLIARTKSGYFIR